MLLAGQTRNLNKESMYNKRVHFSTESGETDFLIFEIIFNTNPVVLKQLNKWSETEIDSYKTN